MSTPSVESRAATDIPIALKVIEDVQKRISAFYGRLALSFSDKEEIKAFFEGLSKEEFRLCNLARYQMKIVSKAPFLYSNSEIDLAFIEEGLKKMQQFEEGPAPTLESALNIVEEIERTFGEHFFLSIMKQSNAELAYLVKCLSSFCAQHHKECRHLAEKYGVTSSMERSPIAGSEIARSILNAFPNPVVVVDYDMKIIFFNSAAEKLMSGADNFFMRRLGEAVICAHSADVPEGCGRSASCNECVIRNTVYEAICGHRVHRRRTSMMLNKSSRTENMEFFVTASPLSFERRSFSLLILEAAGRGQIEPHGPTASSSFA